MAYVWRRLLWRTTFVGITGSVSKTTTKERLASVLARHGRTFRSYRNQNNSRTVRCWKNRCAKQMLCDACWELGFRPDEAAR